MTSDSSGDRPLRLGDLAEVDSPEVLRGALRAFRRRMAFRAVWIAGAIAVALVIVPAIGRSTSLRSEFFGKAGEFVGARLHDREVDVQVLDVRRIDPRHFGVHLVATSKPLRRGLRLMPEPLSAAIGTPARDGAFTPYEVQGEANVVEVWIHMRSDSPVLMVRFLEAGGDNISVDRLGANPRLPTDETGFQRRGGLILLGEVLIDPQALGIDPDIWR